MVKRYNLDRGCHSVYSLNYHFVQCIKYRKNLLVNSDMVDLLKTQIHKISETFSVEVLNIEADKNHFHLLFKAKPTLDMIKYINSIKTITSRELQRNFQKEVRRLIYGNKFWSASYFLATTGQVTLDILKKYVEGQGKCN